MLDTIKPWLGKVVKHFKGDLYLVLMVAEHCDTGQLFVVYKALYDDCKVYIRPLEEFMSKHPKFDVSRFEITQINSVKGEFNPSLLN